jgi:F0F1-type ATP synthase beta subunit
VVLEDIIAGFEEILSGTLDHLPEQAFYMKGGIDEVKKAAEEMAKMG